MKSTFSPEEPHEKLAKQKQINNAIKKCLLKKNSLCLSLNLLENTDIIILNIDPITKKLLR